MENSIERTLTKKQLRKLKHNSEKLGLRLKVLKAKELESKREMLDARVGEEERNHDGMDGTKSEPRKAQNTYLRIHNKAEISIASINYVLVSNNSLKSKMLDASYSISQGTFVAIGVEFLYCNIYLL